MLLALTVVGGPVAGQPKDGDLIINAAKTSTLSSYTAYLDPAKPGMVRTILSGPASTHSHSAVRMAENNTDLVLFHSEAVFGTTDLATLTPAGALPTLHRLPGRPVGFELDHDATWVIALNIPVQQTSWNIWALAGLSGSTVRAFAVLFSNPVGRCSYQWDNLVIDRDPGAYPYCLTDWKGCQGFGSPNLVMASRTGIASTVGLRTIKSTHFDLDPRSGDYVHLVPDPGFFDSTIERSDKKGMIKARVVVNGYHMSRVRITQDNHAWIAANTASSNQPALLEFDLSRNAVVSTLVLSSLGPSTLTGVDIYGSRRLVCNQPPTTPNTVTINVQSRNPQAAGASYILAASPTRRPGMKFANGEWLDLDVTDPLFFLTAQNRAPQVFANFRGTLDPKGNNTKPIRVNIPPGLPQPGKTAIFVGGVIYKGSNIIQVTNSHWFVY
jgi:hypothetical protein